MQALSHILLELQGGNFRKSLNAKCGSFLLKPDTQLRVSPCFSSQTQPACPFPNSRIFRCEGISFIPRAKQRSTFPRLSPQERQNYITSPLPASIAASAQTGAEGQTLHAKTQIPHRLQIRCGILHHQPPLMPRPV